MPTNFLATSSNYTSTFSSHNPLIEGIHNLFTPCRAHFGDLLVHWLIQRTGVDKPYCGCRQTEVVCHRYSSWGGNELDERRASAVRPANEERGGVTC